MNFLQQKATALIIAASCFMAGASSVILLERFDKIPAACVISQEAYDYLATQEPAPIKR
jgi:hypothetical protein